ncbi:acriflavin resistance protein [Spirochaetia bacterium]|nr:acriflavin resistance protein [Spirochaetia bacterium]
MKELISLCVRRPVTMIMIMAALLIAAVFSFSTMSLDRLPELPVPVVTVETLYPGMAANDVRTLVTIPVEDALSPVKGLERMRSISRDGRSLVSMDFRWGTDPMAASALVREAIDAVYPSLPEGIRKPSVTPGDATGEPHAIIAAYSRNGDGNFARRLAEYELRARLRRIDGVGSVLLVGGELAEERLRLDVPRLSAFGINPPDFVRLLSGETADIPAGNAREGNMELVVVSSGRPASVSELAEIVLPAGTLKVGDSGELNLEARRRESVFVFDGKEAAALEIYRRPGADPLRLSREIQKVLKETVPLFSRDADIVLVWDSAPSLVRGITGLLISAALGAVAVISVLLFFIRRLRYSLLAAFSIPVSAAAGICVLGLAGRSLNSMSLGGLALGIGLVSDVSVIVLDLLHRAFGLRHEKPGIDETGGKTASIAGSSIASTITTAVVFVPVIFLPGPLGSLFGDTALALVASITAGWMYAQFCLPSLYRLFFKTAAVSSISPMAANSIGSKYGKLETRYRIILAPLLRRPVKIFVIAALASLTGALLLLLRPVVFISPDETEEVQVSVIFPPGTLLEYAGTAGAEISRFLSEQPVVKTIHGRAGAEEEDVGRRADTDYRREELVLRCVLAKGVKPEGALAEISRAMKDFAGNGKIPPDAEVSVRLPKDRTEVFLGLSSAHTFAIKGKDRGETIERAGAAMERFKAASVNQRPRGSRSELRLYPNRETAAYLSMSAANIAENLYTLNEGVIAARLEIEGRPLDVRVTGQTNAAGIEPEQLLENIPLQTPQGKTVYLGSLGRIERREAEAALARLDRSDVIYLDAPSAGRKTAEELKDYAARFSWFARADESVFSRYRNSLIINICLVLILLYMTMGAQFESFLLPLVLMLSIPFSLAGAGPALLLFGARLDSGAVLGLTTLFGLVVNNSLILFEISDEKIRSGSPAVAAVYGGASERLQPVLITAATTVFALLPLALSPLGNSQRSMAAAMLGGLAASTLLSLFALPPVLIRFFSWRETQ